MGLGCFILLDCWLPWVGRTRTVLVVLRLGVRIRRGNRVRMSLARLSWSSNMNIEQGEDGDRYLSYEARRFYLSCDILSRRQCKSDTSPKRIKRRLFAAFRRLLPDAMCYRLTDGQTPIPTRLVWRGEFGRRVAS